MDRLTIPHDGKRIALGVFVALLGLSLFTALILILVRAS
jgi:hypothetical protein